jgi:DNA/RNA-binding domain of Phe-tRNA-synthetase-like protein
MTVRVADATRAIVDPRTIVADGMVVAPRSDALDQALSVVETRLRVPDAERDAATARTRAMYRAYGVDPTRTRPSSEALLRRVRKGERLPSINNLVDVVNWCSVESQVPFGLYDQRTIGSDVAVRLGEAGEGYEGIRKDWVNVAGRLVVADEAGPFGNPTSDSARAMVTAATSEVFVVLFFPVGTPVAFADDVALLTRKRLEAYGTGRPQ